MNKQEQAITDGQNLPFLRGPAGFAASGGFRAASRGFVSGDDGSRQVASAMFDRDTGKSQKRANGIIVVEDAQR